MKNKIKDIVIYLIVGLAIFWLLGCISGCIKMTIDAMLKEIFGGR